MTARTTTGLRPELAAPPRQAAVFRRALRAEWTKFRSVRGWSIGLLIGALLTIFLGVFAAGNASIGCGSVINGVQKFQSGKACLPAVPLGPGGEAVSDAFYFVHQPLSGNGTITVALTSLTGRYSNGNSQAQVGGGPGGQFNPGAGMTPGLMGWSKTGIIIKASTKQGSAYAAMMVTGSHGVRMQYNFTGDIAGLAGSVSTESPRWLRLTRSGDTISGYDSTDGQHWTLVGMVQLAGLPANVQAGLFATSPQFLKISQFTGGNNIESGASIATGVFHDIRLQGSWPAARWTGTSIGTGPRGDYPDAGGDYHQSAGQITVTGSGDIAPVVPGPGSGFPSATVDQTLVGIFVGLIAIVTVAALFVTSEYRRGLIRVTLAATPRRGQVLAAKAVVAGLVSFVVGLVAAIVCMTFGLQRLSRNGLYVLPVSAFTDARVLVGTAATVAVTAVLALAIGVIVRRSAAAVTTAIVTVVLPFLLAVTVLPNSAANWILRLTPAAGLAVEQSIPHYSQVSYITQPAGGQYPLPPLAGFGVLCAWTAAAIALAVFLLRRRDV
jgi:ABC-type transport system involved in multi-copper enzyme maturation permease subunit